jgi:hypothetical protein
MEMMMLPLLAVLSSAGTDVDVTPVIRWAILLASAAAVAVGAAAGSFLTR